MFNAIGGYPYNRVAASTLSCEQLPLRRAFHAVRDKMARTSSSRVRSLIRPFLDQHATRVLCIAQRAVPAAPTTRARCRFGGCSIAVGGGLRLDDDRGGVLCCRAGVFLSCGPALFSPRPQPTFFPGVTTAALSYKRRYTNGVRPPRSRRVVSERVVSLQSLAE
jgi:hypothetical protein